MPTNRNELKKMSYKELQSMYRDLARRANHRIEQVGTNRKYSNVYARKYDPILYGNTIPNIGTKKGMFALAKRGTKENLMTRIQTVERFLDNVYTDAKHVGKYVEELLSRTQLQNRDNLEKLFDLYREMGFDDYKDDSDKIIEVMSEMYNAGYDPDRLLRWLNEGEYRTQEEHIEELKNSWDYMQLNAALHKGDSNEHIYDLTMTALERRKDR